MSIGMPVFDSAPVCRQLQSLIYALAQNSETFTADDLRFMIRKYGVKLDHPNQVGHAFRTMRQKGLIEAVAVCYAGALSRNKGMNRVWVGVRTV